MHKGHTLFKHKEEKIAYIDLTQSKVGLISPTSYALLELLTYTAYLNFSYQVTHD